MISDRRRRARASALFGLATMVQRPADLQDSPAETHVGEISAVRIRRTSSSRIRRTSKVISQYRQLPISPSGKS